MNAESHLVMYWIFMMLYHIGECQKRNVDESGPMAYTSQKRAMIGWGL